MQIADGREKGDLSEQKETKFIKKKKKLTDSLQQTQKKWLNVTPKRGMSSSRWRKFTTNGDRNSGIILPFGKALALFFFD